MSNPSESSPVPDEVIRYARASLKLGISVPEIEKRLIAKGLTPVAATAVVNSILDAQAQERFEPLADGEGGVLLHRLLSVIVACGCIILGYKYGEGLSAGITLIWVLLPLACIWFPGYLTQRTPAGLIRAMGWLVLLLIGGYRIVLLIVAS